MFTTVQAAEVGVPRKVLSCLVASGPIERRAQGVYRTAGAPAADYEVDAIRIRKLWGAHDVREHRTGIKSIHHPIVGDLDLTYQAMDLASDRGLQMLVFSAEPGSVDADRLQLLANWATTHTPQPATLE